MIWTDLLPPTPQSLTEYIVQEGDYEKAMNVFEMRIEDNIKSLFGKIGIQAMTKTERKSLPYNRQITTVNRITSIVNDAYQTEGFLFDVVKEIINSGNKKVRFYVECLHKETEGNYYNNFFEINFNYYEANTPAEKN